MDHQLELINGVWEVKGNTVDSDCINGVCPVK